MALSDEAKEAAAIFRTLRGQELHYALVHSLSHFLGADFEIGPLIEGEIDGGPAFPISICTLSEAGVRRQITSDRLGAVIDLLERLDVEALRASYAKISHVKGLPRPDLVDRADGRQQSDTTLGAIYAAELASPMADIVEVLDALNRETPSHLWPDIVVIGDVGTIEYGVQFPGERDIGGAFLPPARHAARGGTPAIYIVMVERPPASFAFNRFLAYLVPHLALFSPDAKLPAYLGFLEGAPKTAVTATGYQYNLGGVLRPVPRNMYNNRLTPEHPLQIVDRKGKVLSTIGFISWQDGGVVWLEGTLPLEGLMVFMTEHVARRGKIIRRENGMQTSDILPITEEHYQAMLANFQARSNMKVRPHPQKWVIQKMANEGTASPYVARLMLGLYRIRDAAYLDDVTRRDRFDTAFDQLSSSLENTRVACSELVAMWGAHTAKVATGEIVEIGTDRITITESITKELRRETDNFLNASVRTIKFGLQNLSTVLNYDIKFLFQKQPTFVRGLAALEQSDVSLARYIERVRQWSEPLIEARNAIEHFGWTLPNIEYRERGHLVEISEPQVAGRPVTEYASHIVDRLCCLAEDFTAYALSQKLTDGILLVEIPKALRIDEAPERFHLVLSYQGAQSWQLNYNDVPFEHR